MQLTFAMLHNSRHDTNGRRVARAFTCFLLTGIAVVLSQPFFGVNSIFLFALPMAFTAWLFPTRIGLVVALLGTLTSIMVAHHANGVTPMAWSNVPMLLLVGTCVVLAHWVGDLGERVAANDGMLHEHQQQYSELLATTQRQTRELMLLDQVRTALAREIELSTVVRTMVEAIAGVFGYTHVSVYLRTAGDAETLQLQHQIGYHQVLSRIPIGQSIMGRVVRTGVPILLEDVRTDSHFLGAIDGIISELAVPLHNGTEVVGVLNLESTQIALSTYDLRLMQALAQHISMAVARGQLYAEARESEARFRAIFEHAPVMINSFTVAGRCILWNRECEKQLGYSFADLEHVLDPFAVFYPDPTDRQAARESIRLRDGLFHEFQVRTKHGATHYQMWANFALPTGNTISVGYDITQRKQQEQQLRHEVVCDPLTGIFNRRYLDLQLPMLLEQAEAESTTLAVIMIDVDFFKRYNDTYGHAIGDHLLIVLGTCLHHHIRTSDLLCRYGGEEFTLVMKGVSLENAMQRLEHVRQQAAIMHHNNPLLPSGVTLSMGVALYPLHGERVTDLLAAADRALYQAKARGRDQIACAEVLPI